MGAVSPVVGAVLAIVGNALHPRTSADEIGDPAAYLTLVHESAAWSLVHTVIILASLLLVAQFSLSRVLAGTPGASVGSLALVFAAVGGAVNLVDLLIDGAAMPELAARWTGASGADRRVILESAEAVRALDFGLLSGIMIVFFGLPFLLFGWAVAVSGSFARWLGAVGAGAGLAITLIGFWQSYDGVSAFTYNIAFPPLAGLLSLWLAAVGVLMWRRSSSQIKT